MTIKFKKIISDELYIDKFSSNTSLSLEYDGPDTLFILVDKENGNLANLLQSEEDKYNPDFFELIKVDASKDPDVAFYLDSRNKPYEERQHETVTLIDGSTYEKISNPELRDYYSISYDLEKREWVWKVITVNPRSVYNEMADLYREYINQNMEKLSSDPSLSKAATNYLNKLDAFEKTGAGSIESWKITTPNTKLVPLPPPAIVTAIEYTP